MHVSEAVGGEPALDPLAGDELHLGGVQLVEHVQGVAFEAELAEVVEVFVVGQKLRRQPVDRIHRRIQGRGHRPRKPQQPRSIHVGQEALAQRFHHVLHQEVALVGIHPDDEAAARLDVPDQIRHRAIGVVGVVEHADAEHHVELTPQIDGRQIALDEPDVVELAGAFAGDVHGVQIHRGHAAGLLGHEGGVLAAAAAALQHVLAGKVRQAVGGDPVLEQEPLLVLQHRPLVVPLALLALLRPRCRGSGRPGHLDATRAHACGISGFPGWARVVALEVVSWALVGAGAVALAPGAGALSSFLRRRR